MNVLHLGINLTNNTIHIGPWSDTWTENNKLECLRNISHNFILNDVQYPTDMANYIDILTLDPCISYDGIFHIDSPNQQLTIKLFLSKLFKHIGSDASKTCIKFYYYNTLIGVVDDIISNLTYQSTWCNIM